MRRLFKRYPEILKELWRSGPQGKGRVIYLAILWLYCLVATGNLFVHFIPSRVTLAMTVGVMVGTAFDVVVSWRRFKREKARIDRKYEEDIAAIKEKARGGVERMVKDMMNALSYSREPEDYEVAAVNNAVTIINEVAEKGKYGPELAYIDTWLSYWGIVKDTKGRKT